MHVTDVVQTKNADLLLELQVQCGGTVQSKGKNGTKSEIVVHSKEALKAVLVPLQQFCMVKLCKIHTLLESYIKINPH